MLTYLLFRFSLAFPGVATGAQAAADTVVSQVETQPAAEKSTVDKPTPTVETPTADKSAEQSAKPAAKPVAAAQTNVDPTRPEAVDSARVAQVRLADMLGTAEAIHSVRARGNKVTFTITRGADTVELVATTRRGELTALSIVPAPASTELGGGLSWLGEEMAGITAITKLVSDEDGAVTLTTDDGRRYMLIPGRGSGGSGNEAAASRFAGEFDRT